MDVDDYSKTELISPLKTQNKLCGFAFTALETSRLVGLFDVFPPPGFRRGAVTPSDLPVHRVHGAWHVPFLSGDWTQDPQAIPEGRRQVKNSRPVRLLSLVSKVMERVQSGQLKEYLPQGYSSDRHSQKKWNKALDKPLDARAAALKPGHRLWTKVCWPSGNLLALEGLPLGFYRAIQQTKEVHLWVHVFL